MKQFSVVLIFLVVYSFSLFSCAGVQPIANSNKESPITMQDSAVTSPLQPKVVATDEPTATIDPACEAVIQDVAINTVAKYNLNIRQD